MGDFFMGGNGGGRVGDFFMGGNGGGRVGDFFMGGNRGGRVGDLGAECMKGTRKFVISLWVFKK